MPEQPCHALEHDPVEPYHAYPLDRREGSPLLASLRTGQVLLADLTGADPRRSDPKPDTQFLRKIRGGSNLPSHLTN
jgi:hypothetical protein